MALDYIAFNLFIYILYPTYIQNFQWICFYVVYKSNKLELTEHMCFILSTTLPRQHCTPNH